MLQGHLHSREISRFVEVLKILTKVPIPSFGKSHIKIIFDYVIKLTPNFYNLETGRGIRKTPVVRLALYFRPQSGQVCLLNPKSLFTIIHWAFQRKMVNQKFRHAFIHFFCGFLVTTFGLFVLFQKPILRKSSTNYPFVQNLFTYRSLSV